MLITALNHFSIVVALVGYLVVFIALILLFLIFLYIPKLYKLRIRSTIKRYTSSKKGNVLDDKHEISGQTIAAIGMALHIYFNEMHDQEDMVMTIRKVSKRYSPWSSKIYGLNNLNYRR